jgi:hypothetical protein
MASQNLQNRRKSWPKLAIEMGGPASTGCAMVVLAHQ